MEEISALVLAVGYAMQPQRLAARRTEAAAFLAEHYETDSRYFKRRRLTRLGLPGSLPAPTPLTAADDWASSPSAIASGSEFSWPMVGRRFPTSVPRQ